MIDVNALRGRIAEKVYRKQRWLKSWELHQRLFYEKMSKGVFWK